MRKLSFQCFCKHICKQSVCLTNNFGLLESCNWVTVESWIFKTDLPNTQNARLFAISICTLFATCFSCSASVMIHFDARLNLLYSSVFHLPAEPYINFMPVSEFFNNILYLYPFYTICNKVLNINDLIFLQDSFRLTLVSSSFRSAFTYYFIWHFLICYLFI